MCKTKKNEYVSADAEDQVQNVDTDMVEVYEEETYEETYEEEMYPVLRHYEEAMYQRMMQQLTEEQERERFIEENPLVEVDPPKRAPRPSEDEMAEAYEQFRYLCAYDSRRKKETLIEEWAKSHNTSVFDIPGTLDEQYHEVCTQIDHEVRQYEAERKAKLEVEAGLRSQALKSQKVELDAQRKPKHEKSAGYNKKGKLQGVKKEAPKPSAGRQATRKEKNAKTPVQIISKDTLVPQIVLDEETEEEPEEPIVLSLKEQHLEYSEEKKTKVEEKKPEVKAPPEWTTVSKKVKEVALPKPKTYAPRTHCAETFTRLCISLTTGAKCPHGAKCRFAHSVEQLQHKECRYGKECRYIKAIGVGIYKNTYTDPCSYFHPDETNESYIARSGLKVTPKVTPKVAPPTPPAPKVAPPTPPAPKIAPAPKMAPWAKPAQPTPKVAQPTPKVAQPTPKVAQPTPKVVPQPTPAETKVVSQPAERPTVRVPQAMYAILAPQLLAQGINVVAI